MPKKTREQKKRATEHLKSLLLHQPSVSKLPHTEKNTISQQPAYQETDNKYSASRNYFLIDFKKSIILILGIIALEIIFYFVSMRSDWLKAIYIFK